MSFTLHASLGAAAGAASALAATRLTGDRFATVSGAALVPVALIYPAARRSTADRGAVVREAVGVGLMAAFAAALASKGTAGPRLAAVGWLAHAAFDLVHDKGDGSRLPDWYPAMCAGYDAAYAAVLARA